jgi:hypothetical protein
MPITDVLGHKEIYLQYSSTCYERNANSTAFHCDAIEMGLWDRLEFGLDIGADPEDHLLWNVKAKLAETKDGKGALSAGLWNCDKDYVEPFAVVSWNFGFTRLHLGATHDAKTRLLAGTEVPLGRDFCAMADYISGTDEQLWLGIGFKHPKIQGFDISCSVGVPLNSRQKWPSAVAVGYSFKF